MKRLFSSSKNYSVAAAFTDLVKSFVSAILMPPISIILPINKNIEEKFAVLRAGPNYNSSSPSGGYNTLIQAQSDGAVVMAYGSFIYQMVSFIMVGFSLYGLAHVYTLLSHDPIIKYSKKCQYCLKRINEKVSFALYILLKTNLFRKLINNATNLVSPVCQLQ